MDYSTTRAAASCRMRACSNPGSCLTNEGNRGSYCTNWGRNEVRKKIEFWLVTRSAQEKLPRVSLDPSSTNLQAGENATALPVKRHHKVKVPVLKRIVNYLLAEKKVVVVGTLMMLFCSSTCDGFTACDGC